MRQVTQHEFHTHLRRRESAHNAGTTARYRAKLDDTLWHVAGSLAGVTLGPIGRSRAYYID